MKDNNTKKKKKYIKPEIKVEETVLNPGNICQSSINNRSGKSVQELQEEAVQEEAKQRYKDFYDPDMIW